LLGVKQRRRVNGAAFDPFVAERRVHAARELPLMVPAGVIVEMTGADLDLLYVACGTAAYHDIPAAVVGRIGAASS